jgi:hypothetical protein
MFILRNKTRLVTIVLLLILITTTASSALASRSEATATSDGPVVARLLHQPGRPEPARSNLDVWEVNHAQDTWSPICAPLKPPPCTRPVTGSIDAEKTPNSSDCPTHPRPGERHPRLPLLPDRRGNLRLLAQLVVDHPTLAQWIDIGDSWEKVTPVETPAMTCMRWC